MLPIKSPLDTLLAGHWVAKRNIALILAYISLMTVYGFLSTAIMSENMIERMGVWVTLIVSLVSLALQFLISAMLIFPLHATFLSDGRLTGFAAIRDFGGIWRVALRSFLIFLATLIPAVTALLIGMSLMDGGMREFGALAEAAQAGDGDAAKRFTIYMTAMIAFYAPIFAASVILLGLRIPHIVDRGRVKSASSSIRRGASQFWRMAANLAAGPGTVLFVQYVIWWGFLSTPAEALARGPNHPVTIFYNIIALVIYAYCVAMTAGVLSDAYRRVLAQEAQSRTA